MAKSQKKKKKKKGGEGISRYKSWSSHHGAAKTNATRNHEDSGLISGPGPPHPHATIATKKKKKRKVIIIINFYFFVFSGPLPWQMVVPRLGV